MQAQAKGSLSPEFLALTIEADDTFNLINWSPQFSEPVKSNPILVVGQRFTEFKWPPFIDLDNDKFIIEILNFFEIPEFLQFVIDEEEMQIIMLNGKVP